MPCLIFYYVPRYKLLSYLRLVLSSLLLGQLVVDSLKTLFETDSILARNIDIYIVGDLQLSILLFLIIFSDIPPKINRLNKWFPPEDMIIEIVDPNSKISSYHRTSSIDK